MKHAYRNQGPGPSREPTRIGHRDDDDENDDAQLLSNNVKSDEGSWLHGQQNDQGLRNRRPAGGGSSRRSASSGIATSDDEYQLHDDVYTMLFLSHVGGPAMWFGLSIWMLKLLLFAIIGVDLYEQDNAFQAESSLVRAAQFFMLPVALAIQQDLIATYALIANIRYDPKILQEAPGATRTKWVLGTACRFVDGVCSLAVNFIILLQTTDVLSLMLNFAALQFLQTIDNVAFHLAAEGYLHDRIQEVANQAMILTMPQKYDPVVNAMDTMLFLLTYGTLLAAWLIVTI